MNMCSYWHFKAINNQWNVQNTEEKTRKRKTFFNWPFLFGHLRQLLLRNKFEAWEPTRLVVILSTNCNKWKMQARKEKLEIKCWIAYVQHTRHLFTWQHEYEHTTPYKLETKTHGHLNIKKKRLKGLKWLLEKRKSLSVKTTHVQVVVHPHKKKKN